MSTPMDNASNTETTNATPVDNTATIEQQVNELVDKMKDDSFKLGDDLDPLLKFAAIAEKRRRDTQAGFTKTSQALKRAEAERAELLAKTNANSLTTEQLNTLEELKFSDPEAYYTKRQEMEAENAKVFKENLESISTKVEAEMEIERRTKVLEEFNKTHNIEINDDMIENDIPPKYLSKLQKGEISFEQFLSDVHAYITKPAKAPETPKTPNLNDVGGSANKDYDHKKQVESTEQSWSKTVF